MINNAEKTWWDAVDTHYYTLRDYIELHADAVAPTIELRRIRFALAANNHDLGDMLAILAAAMQKKAVHPRHDHAHSIITSLITEAARGGINEATKA